MRAERKNRTVRERVCRAGGQVAGGEEGERRAGKTLRICALPMGLDFFSLVVYRLQKGRLGPAAAREVTGGATFKA